MTKNPMQAKRHRRKRPEGPRLKVATAIQDQAGAILSCPFCGFLAVECDLMLHIEDEHPETEMPVVTGVAGSSSGSHGRLGSPTTPSGHDNSQPNGTAGAAGHLKASNRTHTSSPRSRGVAAAADAAAAGTATIVAIGSPDGSESTSDEEDDNDGRRREASEELQFEDCPVEGCHESLMVSEMPYHIDLHAVLDFQNKSVDVCDPITSGNALEADTQKYMDASAAGRAKTSSKPLPTLPIRSASGTRKQTRPRVRSFDGSANGASWARSSSVPPIQKRPQRSSSNKSSDSSKSVSAVKLSGNTETRKAVVPQPDGHEPHRERREHRRTRERGRGHGRVSGELGMSTPGVQKSSHQAFLSRKPARSIRSFLALFTGVDSRRHSSTQASSEDRDREKDKVILPFHRRHRHSSSANAPAPKAVQVVSEAPKRLGKAELGKYADEERMPDWLAIYLKQEWGVVHKGMIPVLANLLEQNETTEYAYLCDPCVQHVSRLPKEGGFCGYRNIQTMVSYIVGAEFVGHKSFDKTLPSVFDVQNLIENAWDMGINPRGRVETGGIRLTRKYIGTPEAIALFQSLNIPCSINAFKHKTPGKSKDLLTRDVEQYFSRGNYEPGQKVRATTLPPIYWQHPGHSLTIVGIEKMTSGEMNLLVFDPVFRDTSMMSRLVGHKHTHPDQLLRPYRRGSRYLSRFRAFEILKLQPMVKDFDYSPRPPANESARHSGP